ncbi:MAG TPA: PAS domain S-box protein, partial [Candidatus Wallbacteria bacterium]|nr:PAS domain S-box protein [Candidatus Wallbacteria bacterium]
MINIDNSYLKVLNAMSKAFVMVSIKGLKIDEILKSHVIYINEAFETISGIKTSETTGKEFGDVFKMMLPEWFETIANTCKNNEPAIFECGLTDQLVFYKTEAFMTDNNTLAIIIEDITDLKHANEQIKFQAFLLENINCAIGATDFNGRYIYWNKHMETMFQWKKEDIIGKHILEVRLTEDMKTNDKKKFEQIQKIGYMEFETMCPKKDKTTFPAHVIVASLKNEAGNITALVGIHTDITEKKKMEDAIKLSDERWKFALEGSGDGVFDYNIKTKEMHYSDKWKLITGIKTKND